MSWKGFWRWVDKDFDNTRPYSPILFLIIVSLPLGLAFGFEASGAIIEAARLFAIFGLVLIMAYYLYRMARRMRRSFKSTVRGLKANKRSDIGDD